ncbi:hypothetical protein D9758_001529 [Tetrapyrgos nigripes]|uniref:Uncharacterized protein n=1 Tax=Tetrapyrgos nigripes TaxID=182062 RepID=A0A8H5GX98_9AGAR|nr:hypothetical protein D9758_001529 [Tetrapyrgos nigripes]
MPGKHQQFLEHLDRIPHSICKLAPTTPALREPYNSAVMAMKKLRDLHMRIVYLYIINMSKTSCPGYSCPAQAMLKSLEEDQQSVRESIRGTGGTSLVALLKAGRDATTQAKV